MNTPWTTKRSSRLMHRPTRSIWRNRETRKSSRRVRMNRFQLLMYSLAGAAALPASPRTPSCCWSKWGTPNQCGGFPGGTTGGHCNTDWSKACNSNTDCPDTPVPPPPPPKPAGPSPPPPPPSPPKPPPPPPAPFPDKVVGLYLLIADDGWPYKYVCVAPTNKRCCWLPLLC